MPIQKCVSFCFPPYPRISHLLSTFLADRTTGQGFVVLTLCKRNIIGFCFSNPYRPLLSVLGASNGAAGHGETWEGFCEPPCGPGGTPANPSNGRRSPFLGELHDDRCESHRNEKCKKPWSIRGSISCLHGDTNLNRIKCMELRLYRYHSRVQTSVTNCISTCSLYI